MGIEVSGLSRIMDRLRGMSDNADAILSQALVQGAKMVQASAKQLCPVDTGQLRNSITAEKIPNGARVGSNLEYASHIEYGTGPVAKEAGGFKQYRQTGWSFKDPKTGKFIYTRGQAPQPFLYPALRVNEDRIKQHVKECIIKKIKEG